ncbi:MAG TPA: ATP-binding protein [Pseudolabrys sp.]|nr:ATP-binding protein [Pseudolabrys sp.]
MFKDLRAGTKFLILCGVSLALTSVATYALLTEKQIAISFVNSELVGSKYLAMLRPIYRAVLDTQSEANPAGRQIASPTDAVASLSRADLDTGFLQIGNTVHVLSASLRDLEGTNAAGVSGEAYLSALKNLREIAARIGDDSKLTLDPVLDTYYVQDIVVIRLPTALEEIGQAQLLTSQTAAGDSVDRKGRLIALETLLRTNTDAIGNDLRVAQRGNADYVLQQTVEPATVNFATNANAFLDALRAFVQSDPEATRRTASTYAAAVNGALDAWEATQKRLDQLLMQRMDTLRRQRLISLLLIGSLGLLGLLVAFLTYRDMIVPIKRLADLANTIRTTKNYGLRFDYESRDEIGRLGGAFNEMLGELAVARDREIMGQAEIARVSRLATMGAMVASIAHEIRQPLAAVVANSHAGTRWLEKEQPNLSEARAALKSIEEDGHRANEVITSISAMFKKNANRRVPVDLNELVNDVLNLSRGELRSRKIALSTNLAADLPPISADPVQLREVLLNLVMNGAEAMSTTAENLRALVIASRLESDEVTITVEDSGAGIDSKDSDQIFEAFFTTKPTGMGMGLAICRSIVAAHNGRLWASPGTSRGTVFYVVLPLDAGETRTVALRNTGRYVS